MKKLFIFLSLFLIVVFGLIVYSIFSPKKSPQKEMVVSPPAPIKSLPSGSLPNNYSWETDNKETARRSYLIGELINKLPYETALFSLSYDIDKDLFTLSLKRDSVDDANKNFDLFLKENGVDSRTWIENLVVVYK